MEHSITFQMYCLLVTLVFVSFSVVSFSLSTIFQSRYERRREVSLKDESDWIQTRCVNYCCTRTVARIVVSICVNETYTLYNVAPMSAS